MRKDIKKCPFFFVKYVFLLLNEYKQISQKKQRQEAQYRG